VDGKDEDGKACLPAASKRPVSCAGVYGWDDIIGVVFAKLFSFIFITCALAVGQQHEASPWTGVLHDVHGDPVPARSRV
jgi:hypothetical protein